MNDANLAIRLAEIIANIEERTDSELVSIIQETLMSIGTGYPIDEVNAQYKEIYSELDRRLNDQNVSHPNHFEDLWDFNQYWKDNGLDTYASRRSFIRNLYGKPGRRDTIWKDIHPVIRDIAKPRFDNELYADAVEASFKEMNSRIKEEVRQRTGETYDGASLMNKAFSPKNPIVVLDDLETEDGRNVQNGYMQMFAGAMTAIRNPKAHSNIEIEAEEAIPLIQLASLLYGKYESAIQQVIPLSETEEKEKVAKTLYVRIENADDHLKLRRLKEIAKAEPGKNSLVLVLGKERKSAIRLPFTVNANSTLIEELVKEFGEDNVVLNN